jgi:hypothetical protein
VPALHCKPAAPESESPQNGPSLLLVPPGTTSKHTSPLTTMLHDSLVHYDRALSSVQRLQCTQACMTMLQVDK